MCIRVKNDLKQKEFSLTPRRIYIASDMKLNV